MHDFMLKLNVIYYFMVYVLWFLNVYGPSTYDLPLRWKWEVIDILTWKDTFVSFKE